MSQLSYDIATAREHLAQLVPTKRTKTAIYKDKVLFDLRQKNSKINCPPPSEGTGEASSPLYSTS